MAGKRKPRALATVTTQISFGWRRLLSIATQTDATRETTRLPAAVRLRSPPAEARRQAQDHESGESHHGIAAGRLLHPSGAMTSTRVAVGYPLIIDQGAGNHAELRRHHPLEVPSRRMAIVRCMACRDQVKADPRVARSHPHGSRRREAWSRRGRGRQPTASGASMAGAWCRLGVCRMAELKGRGTSGDQAVLSGSRGICSGRPPLVAVACGAVPDSRAAKYLEAAATKTLHLSARRAGVNCSRHGERPAGRACAPGIDRGRVLWRSQQKAIGSMGKARE